MSNLNDFFMIFLIAVRLIIGIALIRTAFSTRQDTLKWLGAFYFLQVIVNALSIEVLFENPAIASLQNAIASVTYIPLSIFIWQTFYKDKKITPAIWVGLTLLCSIGGLIYSFLALGGNRSDLIMAYSFTGMLPLLNWGWHSWAALWASRNIQSEDLVEDWVKWRYQAMIIYSILLFLGGIVGSLAADPALLDFAVYTGTGLSFIALILQFLVWTMPGGFRKWLNRNQQAHTEERIHGQAQAILEILGSAMSAGTGLSKMLAIFSVRQVIGMEIQDQDSVQVEARAASMIFNEWLATLNNPELYILIKNSAPNNNAAEILDKAKQALSEKQSLFTMKTK